MMFLSDDYFIYHESVIMNCQLRYVISLSGILMFDSIELDSISRSPSSLGLLTAESGIGAAILDQPATMRERNRPLDPMRVEA
jgi:hypothetical protein